MTSPMSSPIARWQLPRQQRRFLFSLAFVAAGLGASYATNVMLALVSLAVSSQSVQAALVEEKAALHKSVKALREQTESPEKDVRITSLPVFLETIGDIAEANGVTLTKMWPDDKADAVYRVEFNADYRHFEKFVSAIEFLDVEIVDLQVRSLPETSDDPKHAITIALVPRNNAARLDIPYLRELRVALEAANRRNPFQRLARQSGPRTNAARIDLTLVLHLSAVSLIDGVAAATLDDLDYRVGDRIDGKTVTEIGADHVLLEQANGDEVARYVTRFRAASNPGRTGVMDATRPAPIRQMERVVR